MLSLVQSWILKRKKTRANWLACSLLLSFTWWYWHCMKYSLSFFPFSASANYASKLFTFERGVGHSWKSLETRKEIPWFFSEKGLRLKDTEFCRVLCSRRRCRNKEKGKNPLLHKQFIQCQGSNTAWTTGTWKTIFSSKCDEPTLHITHDKFFRVTNWEKETEVSISNTDN